jgi:hypothetical protein
MSGEQVISRSIRLLATFCSGGPFNGRRHMVVSTMILGGILPEQHQAQRGLRQVLEVQLSTLLRPTAG